MKALSFVVLLWTCLATALAAAAPSNSDCMECHSDKTLYKTNAAHKAISLFVDFTAYTNSVHGTNTCVSCHVDITDKHPDDNVVPKPVNCASCHAAQSETYRGSAHALALAEGKESAATCIDCHGKHDVLSHFSPASPMHFTRLTQTCGECHSEEAEQVQQSVHGKSSAKGRRDAATCIDCHSEHKIEDLRKVSPIKISEKVCSKCHASERINTKYKMPGDRVRTFLDSYHGLASQYGSTRAANCASCHGVHLILPSIDPKSSVHTNNLVETCGKCHPGATANFTQNRIHGNKGDDFGSKLNYWVRRIYLLLIFGTIGGMLAHNFFSWRRKALAAFHDPARNIQRMDRNQRVQHMLLAVSFIVLAITGFALKFPDSWLAVLLGSDEGFRRWSHRVAGVVMMVLGFYHVYYILAVQAGRKLAVDLLPTKKDLIDLIANLKHLALHGKPKPYFGRFGYTEKLEYWAVVWGTIIMGVTGIMLWFAVEVTKFLPGWSIDVATTIHYYEAVLACLAIVVWHFYAVMFSPDVYPINWAFWDGKVTAEYMEEEHPLDPSAPKHDKHDKPESQGRYGKK